MGKIYTDSQFIDILKHIASLPTVYLVVEINGVLGTVVVGILIA